MSLSAVHPGDLCVYTDDVRTRHLVTVIGMWPPAENEPDRLVNVVTFSGKRGMNVGLSNLQRVQVGKETSSERAASVSAFNSAELVSCDAL